MPSVKKAPVKKNAQENAIAKVLGASVKPITDLWNGTVSVASAVVNTIETPLYMIEAATAAKTRFDKSRENILADIAAQKAKELGRPLTFTELAHINYNTDLSQNRDYQNAQSAFNAEMGSVGYTATNWTRGEKVTTGSDILDISYGKNRIAKGQFDWAGMGLDVALDPTTWIPGGVFIKPLKAAVIGTNVGLKTMKLAKAGQVSERLVAKSELAKTAARVAGKSKTVQEKALAKTAQTVKESSVPLRPGESLLKQYTNKPIIKSNIKRATGEAAVKLNKLQNRIAENFSYRTAPVAVGGVKATDVVASGLEAGYKAAAATLLTEYSKMGIEKAVRAEFRTAKKFEKEAVKLVDENSAEFQPKVNVPHVTPDGVFVRDTKDQVWRFPSKTKADEFIKTGTGKAPKKVTKGTATIVDNAPLALSADAVKAIPASTQSTKQAKSVLDQVNKLSSKATGTSNAENLIPKIDAIVNRVDAGQLSATTQAAIKNVVKNGADPIALLRTYGSKGSRGDEKNFLRALAAKPIISMTGASNSFMTLLKDPKFAWATASPSTKKQVLDLFTQYADGAKGSQASKLEELTGILGVETAAKIAKTGVLDPAKETNTTALQQILAGLPKQAEKKYADFNELLDGLKAGDTNIDIKVLEKIVKLVDPENSTIAKVDKAVSKETSYEQIKNILITKGPQSLAETKRQIELADIPTFLKAEGLSHADAIAVTVQARLDGTAPKLPAAQLAERQAASTRIADSLDAGMQKEVARAADSINKGLSGQFAYLQTIKDQVDAFEGATSAGDMAVRSSKLKKAAIINELTTNTEARIMADAFGKARHDSSFKKIAGGKSENLGHADPDNILKRLRITLPLIDDTILATMGTRIVAKKTAAAAKKDGRHFIYTSTPALVKILDTTTAGRDVLKRALIPDTRKGYLKTDVLDFVAVNEVVRSLVEAKELNKTVNTADLLKVLTRKGENATAWSPKFKAEAQQVAAEFLDYVSKPKVIQMFEDLHIARSLATVEDSIVRVNRLNEDLFHALVQGWKANLDTGIDSTAARAQLVRDWFQKFVYLSGLLEQSDSRTTKAVFQSAALMFLSQGKIARTINDAVAPSLIGSARSADAETRQIWEDITEAINGMYKYDGVNATPRLGKATVPFPSEKAMATATDLYTEAKIAYETHVAKLDGLTAKADIAAWHKDFSVFQTKLDAARQQAATLGIPTAHWDNGEWVPSEYYNHENALAKAKEDPKNMVVTADGIIRAAVTDTPPPVPVKGQKLSKAESEKWIQTMKEENVVRAIDAMRGQHEDNASWILNHWEDFNKLGLDPEETNIRIFQEMYARTYDDAQIKVMSGRISYDTPRGPLGVNEARDTGALRMTSASNAVSGRWETRPVMNRAESTVHNDISHITDAMRGIRNKYLKGERKLAPAEFKKAFAIALTHSAPRRGTDKYVAELAADLRSILDPIFGSPDTSELIKAGISPTMFTKALSRYGLGEELGFQIPTQNGNPTELANYLKWLPFAEAPKALKGTGEYASWLERSKLFKESGEDPFVVLTRLASAIQFAKTEKTFVTDFATRFGWQADPAMSMQKAIENGWVQIKGISGGTGIDLTHYLPEPKNGGLFPPDIAKEFLSLNREWNKIFNDPAKAKEITRAIMDIMGTLKTTQTIFRLGHHVTNLVGDSSAALIAGVTNPKHWGWGMAIAAKHVGTDLATKFGVDKVANKIVRAVESIKNPSRALEVADKYGAKNPAVVINKSGKNRQIPVTLDEWLRLFEERDIITAGIVQNDTPGMMESVLNDVALKSDKNSLTQRVIHKMRIGGAAVAKPVSSVSSYYGNAIRAAHALKVIQSQSWNSIEEALDAANDVVNRYHPTLQSLAARERKYPRIAFTYYTWLRVAHNALLDMMTDHTAAMLIPSKVIYQQSQQAGFQPESIGSPWQDKGNYLKGQSYSVYGPTENGPNGPVVYKRSILPLDVLDTWSFVYDPALSAEGNTFYNFYQLAGTALKSSNAAIKPFGELILQKDLDTNTPEDIQTFSALADKFVQGIGFTSLAKGLGADWAVPYNRRPENTTKPITELEKNTALMNWLGGQKQQNLQTIRTIPAIKREQRARMKSLREMKNQGK
jgi:hypothetical protein